MSPIYRPGLRQETINLGTDLVEPPGAIATAWHSDGPSSAEAGYWHFSWPRRAVAMAPKPGERRGVSPTWRADTSGLRLDARQAPLPPHSTAMAQAQQKQAVAASHGHAKPWPRRNATPRLSPPCLTFLVSGQSTPAPG